MEKINAEQFNELVLESKGKVVVDFFADWCGPCKMLGPVLQEVSEELTDVKFYKVNVDDNNELAYKFKVSSIPTVIVFKDGKPLQVNVGFMPKATIIDWVKGL